MSKKSRMIKTCALLALIIMLVQAPTFDVQMVRCLGEMERMNASNLPSMELILNSNRLPS